MTAPARRPWWKRKRWAAAGLLWLLMPAVYFPAYLAVLQRRAGLYLSDGPPVMIATYPYPALVRFFAPAEWVDRRVRPAYWNYRR